MGRCKQRFGLDGKAVESLMQRFCRMSPTDREWTCPDDFLLWAKESGYKKGLHLRRHIETLPHGPENSYWLNNDVSETKRLFQEKLKQGSDFCKDCKRTCPASGLGCKEWQKYFTKNWDENISIAPPEPERPAEDPNAVKESWTYFDNIDTARVTYDEDTKETVVSCTFKGDSGMTTFIVKHLAYLMSDDGKTIDRIRAAEPEKENIGDKVYDTLQEAAHIALTAED